MNTYNVTVTATLGDRTETITVEGIRAEDEWKARTTAISAAFNRGAFKGMSGFTTDYTVTEVA